jgi:hypothetical protein
VSRKTIDEGAFPRDVRQLVGECIPNVDALELLMVLLEQPAHGATVSELLARIRSSALTEERVRRHLEAFAACGVVLEHEGRYRCASEPRRVRECLEALVQMYHQRPVTLIRAIYTRSDERIRAFSDAFNLRKDRTPE